jgi:Vps5 C terminal like
LTGKKHILKCSSLSFAALSKPSRLFQSIVVVCLFLTLSLLRTSTLWTELASAVGEFAQTVSDLAASDLGKSVSHSLEALADLERKAQETESAQARADQATVLSTADEYARLVNSVRVSTMNRFYSMPRPLNYLLITDGI